MELSVVAHKVADFDAWRAVYEIYMEGYFFMKEIGRKRGQDRRGLRITADRSAASWIL
jgi:hypothetical protein